MGLEEIRERAASKAREAAKKIAPPAPVYIRPPSPQQAFRPPAPPAPVVPQIAPSGEGQRLLDLGEQQRQRNLDRAALLAAQVATTPPALGGPPQLDVSGGFLSFLSQPAGAVPPGVHRSQTGNFLFGVPTPPIGQLPPNLARFVESGGTAPQFQQAAELPPNLARFVASGGQLEELSQFPQRTQPAGALPPGVDRFVASGGKLSELPQLFGEIEIDLEAPVTEQPWWQGMPGGIGMFAGMEDWMRQGNLLADITPQIQMALGLSDTDMLEAGYVWDEATNKWIIPESQSLEDAQAGLSGGVGGGRAGGTGAGGTGGGFNFQLPAARTARGLGLTNWRV